MYFISTLKVGRDLLPDQFKCIVDQVHLVLGTEECVVLIQQCNDVVPSIPLVVNYIIAIHIYIEFHPDNTFLEFQ